MNVIHTSEYSLSQFKEKLVQFEHIKPEETKLFIHNVLTYANLRKEDLCHSKRKVAFNVMTEVLHLDGETVHICNNPLQCLLYIGPKVWKRVQKDALLPEPRSTEKYENNVNKSSLCT